MASSDHIADHLVEQGLAVVIVKVCLFFLTQIVGSERWPMD